MSLWRRIFVERRRVILPLGVFLILNVAVFALAVMPLKHAVDTAESDAMDAKTTLNKARLADRSAKDIRTRRDQADVELKKFYADVLPHDLPTARELVYSWCQTTAAANRLTLRNAGWDQDDLRDSQLWRVTGKITLSGDYADIRRFLYALETAQEFIVVDKVELGQSTATTRGPNSAIDVVLDVSTYYLGSAS